MSKVLVATIALSIARDAMTILPVTVPRHELKVQRAIFGKENVLEQDDQSDAKPVEIDVETEVERLAGKYGPGALEKAFGADFEEAIPQAAMQFVVEEPSGEGSGEKTLVEMTKAELLAEAAARGVAVDESMTKAKIVEAIEAAAKG